MATYSRILQPGESHIKRSLEGCGPWDHRVRHDRAMYHTRTYVKNLTSHRERTNGKKTDRKKIMNKTLIKQTQRAEKHKNIYYK